MLEETRLLSITSLCQIFTRCRGPFDEDTLHKFYRVYNMYLQTDLHKNALQSLLKNTSRLFWWSALPKGILLQTLLVEKLSNYYINASSETVTQDIMLRSYANRLMSSFLYPFIEHQSLIYEVFNGKSKGTDILHELLCNMLQRDKEGLFAGKLQGRSLRKSFKNLARSSFNLMLHSFYYDKVSSFVTKIMTSEWFDRAQPSIVSICTLEPLKNSFRPSLRLTYFKHWESFVQTTFQILYRVKGPTTLSFLDF